MKYEFTDDYLTGIASVDAQHKKLFDLTNECYELVMGDTSDDKYDKIVAILNELAAYAGTHFAHEEAYGESVKDCLLYTSPSPRDGLLSRMPSSA